MKVPCGRAATALALALLCWCSCSAARLVRETDVASAEDVVLVHGLAGGPAVMWLLGERLRDAGYRVTIVDYPSTREPIAVLLRDLQRQVDQCCAGADRVHFVGHSLGGILVRALLAERRPPNLGRVVLLSSPNEGSELADQLAGNPLVALVLGPSVSELGTSPDSLPNRIGAPDYELGIIAADQSWSVLGSLLIPGPDDGRVAVERMKLDGMADFRTVAETHTFMVNSPQVAAETAHFLAHGSFIPAPAAAPATR